MQIKQPVRQTCIQYTQNDTGIRICTNNDKHTKHRDIKYRLIYMYKNHIKAKKMFNTNDFYIIELQKEN